jgi:dynein heavy chain 2
MLKKVANFYNSMENQIIKEQKAMLLDSLVAFEEVVSNPSAKSKDGAEITWGNPSECETYVERLHKAAERLKLENNRLRTVHSTLSTTTVDLTSINLLASKAKWTKKWNEAQNIMSDLASRYTPQRMSKFLLFWNHQIYKALEASYQLGLHSLNESMGELKCELVYVPPRERSERQKELAAAVHQRQPRAERAGGRS